MKIKKIPNIFLDIDDVIFDFSAGFANHFNIKPHKSWVESNRMKNRLEQLKQQKEFWVTLPVKNVPNFNPKGFVSARSIHKSWTKESLSRNSIPGRSNIHQVQWGESKIAKLKELNATIFIDDKYQTYKECHQNGIFCILMSAPHNMKYKPKYRIDNLDISNIVNLYNKFKNECR